MMSRLRRLPSPALCLAFIAVLLAGAGTSYGERAVSSAVATITGKQIKNRAIKAKHLKTGAVKSRSVKNGSLVAQDFKAGQLPAGPKGSPGAQGNPGPQGPPGPAGMPAGSLGIALAAGTVAGEVVNPYLYRGFNRVGDGSLTLTRTAVGRYVVHMDGVAYHFADYVAAITVSSSDAHFASSNSSGGNLVVKIFDADGMPADEDFHFAVFSVPGS